jgi:hypothetical protein
MFCLTVGIQALRISSRSASPGGNGLHSLKPIVLRTLTEKEMRHYPKPQFPGSAAWFILRDTVLSEYSEWLPKTEAPNIGQALTQRQMNSAVFSCLIFHGKLRTTIADLSSSAERSFVRLAGAQRNHIGLSVRAFLRFEIVSIGTGISRFEAEIRIIRDAIKVYIANPIYALQANA